MTTNDAAGASGGGSKPKKPRSPIERVVVWTLIVALLGLVLWEWRARDSYNASVVALQAAYQEKEKDENDVQLSELVPHFKGYYIRSETPSGDEKRLLFKWPSLFKTYEVRMNVDTQSVVTNLETGDPPPE